MMNTSHKRSHSRSPSPSPLSSLPSSKAARTSPPADANATARHLLCTLPPTCNPPNQPTPLTDTAALEAHYANYHAHVCEEHGCRCVFPEARLLELHQTECHDPIAAMRKERGEKIFACHLPTCNRLFATPKTRRLHLIQAHGFPKEYFFAVTNKGVGGLLRKWGEGASLVRKQWRSRDEDRNGMDVDDDDDENAADEELDAAGDPDSPSLPRATSAPHAHDTLKTNNDTTPTIAQRRLPPLHDKAIPAPAKIDKTVSEGSSSGWLSGTPLVEDSSPSSSEPPSPERGKDLSKSGRRDANTRGGRGNAGRAAPASGAGEEESLTQALDALSLVPSSVRFGRGSSKARGARGQMHGQRPREEGREGENPMDVDHTSQPATGGQGRRNRTGGRNGGHSRNVSGVGTANTATPATVVPTATTNMGQSGGAENAPGANDGGQDSRGRGRGRPPMPPRGLGRGGRGRLGVGVGFGARLR